MYRSNLYQKSDYSKSHIPNHSDILLISEFIEQNRDFFKASVNGVLTEQVRGNLNEVHKEYLQYFLRKLKQLIIASIGVYNENDTLIKPFHCFIQIINNSSRETRIKLSFNFLDNNSEVTQFLKEEQSKIIEIITVWEKFFKKQKNEEDLTASVYIIRANAWDLSISNTDKCSYLRAAQQQVAANMVAKIQKKTQDNLGVQIIRDNVLDLPVIDTNKCDSLQKVEHQVSAKTAAKLAARLGDSMSSILSYKKEQLDFYEIKENIDPRNANVVAINQPQNVVFKV